MVIGLIAGGETVYKEDVASGDLLRGEELHPSHTQDQRDDVRIGRTYPPWTVRRLKVARVSSSKLSKTWPHYQGTYSKMKITLLGRRALLWLGVGLRRAEQQLYFLRNLRKIQHASKDPNKCPQLLCWQHHQTTCREWQRPLRHQFPLCKTSMSAQSTAESTIKTSPHP